MAAVVIPVFIGAATSQDIGTQEYYWGSMVDEAKALQAELDMLIELEGDWSLDEPGIRGA